MREWFLPGTVPTATADDQFVADPAGGPARLLLPPEYAGWCRTGMNARGWIARAAGGLAITRPPDGASYVLDLRLPAAQQELELAVRAPDPREAVRWTVNGAPLAPDERGRVRWRLARGEWEFRAAGEHGEAVSRITVE